MNYYIVENNQQSGPFTVEQLRTKGITKETYVWAEGMSNWQPAGNVSELQLLFQPAPQPQPQPQPYVQPAPQPQSYAQPQQQSYESKATASSSNAQQSTPAIMPKDYKKESIMLIVASMICCNCFGTIWLILGILAMVEGNKVSSMHALGNYQLAQLASEKAHKWIKYGAIGFVITEILSVIGWIAYFLLVVASSSY
ncbi:MAG: DUF4339 domain-containing protein [Prevotella sp.]|nr:DUF4339 domain-containing protein [Prevotella sp.]